MVSNDKHEQADSNRIGEKSQHLIVNHLQLDHKKEFSDSSNTKHALEKVKKKENIQKFHPISPLLLLPKKLPEESKKKKIEGDHSIFYINLIINYLVQLQMID